MRKIEWWLVQTGGWPTSCFGNLFQFFLKLKKIDSNFDNYIICIKRIRMSDIKKRKVKLVIVEDDDLIMNEAQLEREKWVKDYNNSLPQRKWFDKEFQQEYSIAIGGIYDSEYMCYVWDNVKSRRIANEVGWDAYDDCPRCAGRVGRHSIMESYKCGLITKKMK